MPYDSNKDLNPAVKNNLPSGAQSMYREVFNSAKKSGKSDEIAAKEAWGQVNNRFHKGKDGKWVSNSLIDFIEKSYMDVIHIAENERKPKEDKNLVQFSMFINKANLDNNGRMVWAATGSDTDKDSFDEDMSLDLFKSFLNHIENGVNLPIYLSLAHYPRLNGRGEAGLAEQVFIDGNTLKAKGTFKDNPLGVKVYNAIRKDRRDNVPQDQRARISIGFYDQMHKHSNGTVWEYKSGVPCAECAKNPKGGKTYLSGVLEHFAVTRVPVNKRTDIVAKSEGKDMTTRYEDAMSIVGDPTVVDPIERALQEERKDKSDTTNLVEKAVADLPDNATRPHHVYPGTTPVTNNTYGADLNVPNVIPEADGPIVSSYQLLSGLPKDTILKLFGKMEMDGTLTDDDLSKLINEVLNNLTDRSVASDKPEKKKKDVVAGENPETKKLNDVAGHMEMSETTDKAEARKDVSPADEKHAVKEYGDVKFADEENKKYPIDTTEHIRAAWNYINKEANAAKYGGKVGGIKAKIVAAWKEKISKDGPPSAQKSEVDESNLEVNMSKAKDSDNDPEDKKEGPEDQPENDAEDKKEKKSVKKSDVTDGERSTNDTQPDTVKLIGAVEALVNAIGQLIARPASVATIGDKVSEAKEPDGSYNQPLPTNAEDFTTANNQRGPGTPTGPEPNGSFDEASPIKGVVSDFSEAMKVAITKSGDERLAAFQEVINNTANKMKELHSSLNSPEPTAKSEGQTQNIEEVVNHILDQKLIPIQAGQAELKSMIQNLTIGNKTAVADKKVEVPQMKSIVSPTAPPQVQKSQMKSIMDIATATTIGTLGR